MSTRAKFVCISNTEQNGIHLAAVTCGSKENENFFKYTPYGEIHMNVLNDEATKEFKVGKEYYVDFSPAN
jgi:hypothetical protein